MPALLLAVLVLLVAAPPAGASPVTFDRYSFSVGGERVLLSSGEVHPFRMPSPRAWPEVLARMRAAGLNTISIYVPWQLHEPAPGRWRFSGRYDLERFLRVARDARLYVTVRPGPYVQGEIDGGGFPGWLLGRPGVLRTTDPAYTAAWKRWFAAVMPRIARWQVGGPRGGTVVAVQVENEHPGGAQPTQRETEQARAHLADLVAAARAEGITVPITHNDVQYLGREPSRGRYVGVVDAFSFDNYPYQFTCCPDYGEDTFAQVDRFERHYRSLGVTDEPLWTAEVQGGIAPITGDDGRTREERYRRFVGYETVQGLSLLAQGLTHVNRYMTFGGTTWGNLPYPTLGSSYDYAAPIREWGGLGPRFEDLRLEDLQIAAASPSITATDAIEGAVTADGPGLYRVRRSRVDGALHVFLRNADPGPDRAPRLTIDGRTTLPVPLPGHSARWLLADAQLGGRRLAFSTAEVALATRRWLVFFGDRGHRYEAEVDGRRFGFTPRKRPQRLRRDVVVLSRADAARLWPWGRRLLIGPQLVSGRRIETDGRRVLLVGRRAVRRLRVPAPPARVRLPVLRSWRFRAGTPERRPAYDDAGWRRADRRTTTNQMQPRTSPVLAADDYAVPSSGFVWYRGRFTGRATGMCVEGRHRYHVWLNGRSLGTVTSDAEVPGPGGLGGLGAAPPIPQPAQVAFPADAVRDGENVLAVLVESWGHTMDAGAANQAKQARGLISAALGRPCGFVLGGETTQPLGGGTPVTLPPLPAPDGGIAWRLHGGPPRAYPNTSGLHGERRGWHRARFDDRRWRRAALPEDAPLGAGEMGWYRTRLRLRLPRRLRVAVGIDLPPSSWPAEVYVNGVHVARAGRGPAGDRPFVIPIGVLRPRGSNTVAIARWNVASGPRMDRPRLVALDATRVLSRARVSRAARAAARAAS